MHRIICAFLLAVPFMCEGRIIAYSPSINGMPLIFHFNTAYLEPFPFSGVTWTQLQNALLIRSSYTDHIDNLPNRNCCQGWNVWADGMGQWLQQNTGNHHRFGYDTVTGGITVGADTCFNNFLVGAAASYTHSDLQWKHFAGNCQIDSYYGGLYGSWNNGCFYVNGSALGAYSDYHAQRHWHFRMVDRQPKSHHTSGEALAGLEAGMMFQQLFCSVDLVPFVSVDYVYLSQPGYNEEGKSSYNLDIKSRNDQLIQSEVGLQLFRRYLCNFFVKGWTVAPNLSLSYINQTPLTGRSYFINFEGHSFVFPVDGWNFERHLGAVGFNLNLFNWTETVNITFHYDGQFGKNYWIQTGSILCNLSF